MSETITLGGRAFRASEPDDVTYDQYAWIQSAADKAGLGAELQKRVIPMVEAAVKDEKPASEQDAEDMATAIVMRCYHERAHLNVLAGNLVEVGTAWSYESAVKNRDFFGSLKGDDIATVQLLLTQLVLAFFWSGLDSMTTSPRFLSPREISSVEGMGSQMESGSDLDSDSGNSEK